MKRNTLTTLTFAALAVTLAGVDARAQFSERGSFVICNRGSGDITVLAARDGKVEKTVALPKKDDKKGEPMYASVAGNEVLVGDRAHNRVLRFNKRTYRVVGEYKAGNGVFHQWTDGRQLWVNNDVDNTTTVVDLRRRRVIKTIKMPEDLVKDGYKNHDVWTAYGFAWITMIKPMSPGYVILYSGRNFQPIRRAKVGGDPHVWLDRWSLQLVIPSQGGDRTDFLNPLSLAVKSSLALKGSHGVYSPPISRALYVTNLPGGGMDDLYNIRQGFFFNSKPKLTSTASTGNAVAHNISTTPFGTRIAVTHSGPTSRTVTIHEPVGSWWAPSGTKKIATVKAGVNPFGLVYVR